LLFCTEDEASVFLRNICKLKQTKRRHIPEDRVFLIFKCGVYPNKPNRHADFGGDVLATERPTT
jgi:hypothetical protein